MKRRIFLALLLTAAACGAASARAQTPDAAPQVPPHRITLEEVKRLRAENKNFVLDVRIGINTKIKGAAYIPPNPKTNDGKPPATVAPNKTDGASAQPTETTTQAPTKTPTKSKRSKHRRTKPGSD